MRRWSRFLTVFVLASGGLLAAPPRAARAAPSEPTAGDDLSRLKQDLEALRQEYMSRIAALESRIADLEGSRTPEPAAAPLPPTAATASRVFNPDIAGIGNFVGAAGRSPGGGEPSLELHEAEASFQAIVDPYARADFFVTLRAGRGGARGGLPHLPDRARRLPHQGREDARRVRQDRTRCTRTRCRGRPPARLDRTSPAARTASPTPGSPGPPHSEPVALPGGDRLRSTGASPRSSRRPRGAISPTSATCARTATSASPRTSTSAARSRTGHNGVTDDATTRLLGVDATLRWKPLRRSIYTHFLARSELVWSRADEEPADRRTPSAATAQLEYQFAPPLDRRPALRQLRASGERRAPGQRRLAAPHLLAERVQPGPRPVPPHPLRRRRQTRPTSCSSSSCSRSAPTAPIPSEEAAHDDSLDDRRIGRPGRGPAGRPRPSTSWPPPRTWPPSPARWAATGSRSSSIARGYQDPHYVEAKPSFILKLTRADLLVVVGRELEIGWLPPLILQSRNAKIQVGRRRLPRRLAHREDPGDPDRTDHPRHGRRPPPGQPALLARPGQRPADRAGHPGQALPR